MQCLHCKGNLEEGIVNYPVDLGEQFILVKEVPASVCKQCGEFYLDDDVFMKIEKIVYHLKSDKLGIEIEVVNYKQSA